MFIKGASASAASWSYRGTVLTSNYTQSLNVGDSLTLQCQAFGTVASIANTGTVFQALIVTKTSASGQVTVTAGTTSASTLTTASGTLVWDPINGHAADYSHWNVIQTIASPGNTVIGRGLLSIYIPYIRSVDAGTFYCNYGDGSATGFTTGIASSQPFVLTVTTRGSKWRRHWWDDDDSSTAMVNKGSKYLQYSALLVASSKLIL